MRPVENVSVRGFSMIELMVAMLIGLIGMIIIFQVFEVSEGIKRTTTSGGDAQQNGAVALFVIERDLRSAGNGFNETPMAGCEIIGFDSKRGATPDFPPVGTTMLLVPARITSTGVATDPDQLTLFYGSNPKVVNATTLTSIMTLPLASPPTLTLKNAYGYRPGDLIVLQDPAAVPAKKCSVVEVTRAPSPAYSLVDYADNGGNYQTVDPVDTVVTRFNKPGGMGVIYNGTGAGVTRVYNMGNIHQPKGAPDLPVHNTYAIVNRSLTVTSLFVATDAPASPQVSTVADNIVHLRALYGVDDGPYDANGQGDGILERFVDVATFNAIGQPWRHVLAVRVTLVARSALAEKPSEGASGCDATTDGTEVPPGPDRRPKWTPPGAVGVPVPQVAFNLTADPDWKCYRYRVFETTVPLRNWIWRSS
jgi:type IV pilus assembly protein PilW